MIRTKWLYVLLFLCSFQAQAGICHRIGLLGEFKRPTGSFSQPFGNEIKRGSALAEKLLKKKNENICIQFETIDIDNSISNIDGKIRKAASQGTKFFVGLGTSDQALASRKALLETKSVLITPTASAMALKEGPRRIVMLFPDNEMIVQGLIKEIGRHGIKKILSIYASNNQYSLDMHRSFLQAATVAGIEVLSEAVRSGKVELSKANQVIIASKIEWIFLPLFELDTAKVLAQLQRENFKGKFIGTDSWGTFSTVIRNLVGNVEAIIPVIYDPEGAGDFNQAFLKSYREDFQRSPSDLAAFSFDAVNIAVRMQKTCGLDVDTEKLPGCLQSVLPMDSTSGDLSKIDGLSILRPVQTRKIQFGRKI